MSNIADLDVDGMGEARTAPEPGWYHIKLIRHENTVTKKGTACHKFTWQIIGTPPELRDETGKYIYESFYPHSSVFFKQVAGLGWALGIHTKEYLKSLQANGEDLPMPEFESWLYKTCIGKVFHEDDPNDPSKFYAKIGFNYKPTTDAVVQEAGIVLDTSSIEAGMQVSAKKSDDVF